MFSYQSFLLFALLFPAATAFGQQPAAASPSRAELLNMPKLKEDAKALLEKARAGSGSASVTLASYPGHRTMLSARTASGGAEQHMHFADFLIVLEGEGTELTGGTIVDRKGGADGENRGSKLEGAVSHQLHAGDVLHIPAGMPHQAIEASGQNITVFVIKVQEPAI